MNISIERNAFIIADIYDGLYRGHIVLSLASNIYCTGDEDAIKYIYEHFETILETIKKMYYNNTCKIDIFV